MNPKHLRQIEYRQLCALVKGILLQDHAIDDAEWKARTHETMARWGFAPLGDPEQLTRAMTQVEQALKRTIGVRPLRDVPVPTVMATPQAPPKEGRTSRPAGWDVVLAVMARLRTSRGSGPSSTPQPREPRETLELSEAEVLNEFWRAANEPNADRLALLRAFAEVAIVRPSGWNYLEVRERANDHGLQADRCFACAGAAHGLSWHHILQVQFGGSNYVRNRVAICALCHEAVHPWLPEQPRKAGGGLVQVGSCAPAVVADLTRDAASRKA